MNKISKYTHFIANGNNTLLYNIASDQVLALQPEAAKIVNDNLECVDAIQTIHPTLYGTMLEKGFVVDSEIDETKRLIEVWNKYETSSSIFSVIINPTLACNMRCWYCYEEHNAKRTMTTDVLESIIKLIDKRISNPELKMLHLDFFGGEPLICFDKIVWSILQHAKEACAKSEVKLTVHFTTNAYLLTKQKIDLLASLGCNVSFQITLDGNRDVHDSIRFTNSGKPSFDKIVKHIKLSLANGMAVNCRLNYTKESLESMLDIITEFENLPKESKRLLNFNFQQVWQDKTKDCKKVSDGEESIVEKFRSYGLSTTSPSQYISRHCYGDFENCIVVNYNGDIFKCTGRDFIPKLKEGVLLEDGTIEYNEIYKRRMELKRGNAFCQQCSVYPICHCGCSQHVLDKEDALKNNLCLYEHTEEQKQKMIIGRLKSIISSWNAH